MPRVVLATEVTVELDEISLTIWRDNPIAANRWLDRISSTFADLARQPHMGGAEFQTKRWKEARRFPFGSYVIYYRPIDDGVEILRVYHGARDQGDLA